MYNYGRMNKHYRYGRGDDNSRVNELIDYYKYPFQAPTTQFSSNPQMPFNDPNERTVTKAKNVRDVGRDNIYFNIEISNPLKSNSYNIPPYQNSQNSILAEYIENLTQPILSNPSQYYLTIARFTVPGLTIPIIDMDIIGGQPNPNLTPYVLTLSYLGNDFPENIYYYTGTNLPLPLPPIPVKQQSEYYYIFEYYHMVEMMNITLKRSFTALKAAFPAAPPTEPPFFFLDKNSQLLNLVVQNSYSEVIAGAPTIEVWCNNIFYTRFTNAMSAKFINDNQPNGKDLRYLFPPTTIPVPVQAVTNPTGTQLLEPKYNDLYALNSSFSTTPAPFPPGTTSAVVRESDDYTLSINNPATAGLNNAYLYNTQEFVTLQYWNSFKNIVFTTSTIPVQAEYVPATNSSGLTSGGQIAYKPILTDFEPILSRAGDARTLLQYFPSGPYRLIDLLGTQPLQKIDIKIFWQDIYDNLHPLEILANEVASVKLLFIRKEDYS